MLAVVLIADVVLIALSTLPLKLKFTADTFPVKLNPDALTLPPVMLAVVLIADVVLIALSTLPLKLRLVALTLAPVMLAVVLIALSTLPLKLRLVALTLAPVILPDTLTVLPVIDGVAPCSTVVPPAGLVMTTAVALALIKALPK